MLLLIIIVIYVLICIATFVLSFLIEVQRLLTLHITSVKFGSHLYFNIPTVSEYYYPEAANNLFICIHFYQMNDSNRETDFMPSVAKVMICLLNLGDEVCLYIYVNL